ncbi:MAG TPA: NADPH:quinone oxidoreductase family protein [Acidimicrobiia bacterium]|nr:NADPH:quinone oxidoreductase family protein [Acidimicrobiia bacterium]
MRALRVHRHGEPDQALQLEDVSAPVPEPGQVTVRVAAAALGLQDLLLVRGSYQLKPPLPFTPGMEAAGTVVAVGEGVDGSWVGQRVVGVPALPDGALAESARMVATNLFRLPDDVTDTDAAATHISFTTAHVALHRRAALQPGETLLVHAGAGGTGSAAIQLGAVAGARVIATAGSPERTAVCRELGASVAIDYRREDFEPVVRDLTDGRGADVIFDPVGGDVFDRSRHCIASEGRLLLIGFASGAPQTIKANGVLLGNYSVMGVYMGAYSRDADRALVRGVHEDVMRLLSAGTVRALVSREVGLDEVAAALADLRDRGVIGRVVVRPG